MQYRIQVERRTIRVIEDIIRQTLPEQRNEKVKSTIKEPVLLSAVNNLNDLSSILSLIKEKYDNVPEKKQRQLYWLLENTKYKPLLLEDPQI